MKIIKRSGMEVEFDRSKIIAAVKRANNSVVEGEKVSDEQVEKIAENVETICEGMNRANSCPACPHFLPQPRDTKFHLLSQDVECQTEGIPSGK